MGNVHLVTGYAGRAHVTAADHGSLWENAIRGGDYILNSGQNFAPTVVSANEIRLADGEGVTQGRHFKIDPGATESVPVESGAQGVVRSDLIVARYMKDAATGIESHEFAAITGTAVAADPVDPDYTTGNINADGDILHEFPVYRVSIEGLNVVAVTPLFEPQPALFDALANLSSGLSITKVWENASPGSKFAAQTVALDLSKAKGVSFYYRNQTAGTFYLTSGLIEVGDSFVLDYSSKDGGASIRKGTVNADGITFEAPTTGVSGITASETIVPIKIYAWE